jgi:23S rRNA pseudouridine1911/1915/1917 synthase
MKILEARTPGQYFSLIHRLDRDTSGVLLLGLSPFADRAFKMLLEGTIEVPPGKQASVKKTYRAITWGIPQEGCVDLPLEPDLDNPLRVKMRIARPGEGLPAQTVVRVLDRIPPSGTSQGYAWVECQLLTGRQHQIRVHLAAGGTPVVGDKLYGPNERLHARAADKVLTDEDRQLLEHPRQALHAHRYELPHAVTWAPLDLVAPFAKDLVQLWRRLSGDPSWEPSAEI